MPTERVKRATPHRARTATVVRHAKTSSPQRRPAEGQLLTLQRQAGNAATALLVQRSGGGADSTQKLVKQSRRQAAQLGRVIKGLERLPAEYRVGKKLPDATKALARVQGEIDSLEARYVSSKGKDVDAQQGLLELADGLDHECARVQMLALDAARQAHEKGEVEDRDTFIEISSKAEKLAGNDPASLGSGDAAERTGAQGAKDKAAAATGVGSAANDGLGGLGGAGVSIADTVSKAGSAAGPMTGAASVVGAVGGAFGALFGVIGIGLGAKAAKQGAGSEARLKELIDAGEISDDQVKELAAFAQEKKRKKKLGGGISATIGAAGLTAGVVGIIAVSVATFGLAAIVAGIGAALMGLGLVLGKWIHKKKKRKAFEKKIPGLADGLIEQAVEEGGDGPVRRHIAALGVTVDWTEEASIATASGLLASELSDRIKSRREFVALSLIGYLTGPASVAMFDAEKVVEALHLDPAEIRRLVAVDGGRTAQARLADKMASW